MGEFKGFFNQYRGGIIGAIIAILFIIFGLDKLIIGIVIILIGIIIGNYVQQNKPEVKEKLKNFIDKM